MQLLRACSEMLRATQNVLTRRWRFRKTGGEGLSLTKVAELVRKTLFWKTGYQIARARISADFGRVVDDVIASRHPSRGSDPVSGCRGAGLPSLVGGRGRGAEREAPAGSPSDVANFVLALRIIYM